MCVEKETVLDEGTNQRVPIKQCELFFQPILESSASLKLANGSGDQLDCMPKQEHWSNTPFLKALLEKLQ